MMMHDSQACPCCKVWKKERDRLLDQISSLQSEKAVLMKLAEMPTPNEDAVK